MNSEGRQSRGRSGAATCSALNIYYVPFFLPVPDYGSTLSHLMALKIASYSCAVMYCIG